MTSPDPEQQQQQELQQKWAPEWTIWRSRNSRGELNEWCATHRDPNMTLMARTADELEKALVEQSGRRPITYG